MDAPVREIERPKFDRKGLVVEPRESDQHVLIVENHNRMRFSKKVFYADPYEGDGRTYDPTGRYNCGACNQADGVNCAFVQIDRLDLEAGSCQLWENICAGDPEVELKCITADLADYAVAANGVGFGCFRCPYSSKSVRGPDSQGRGMWCGKGAFRVFETSCCALNGAETIGDGDGDADDAPAPEKDARPRLRDLYDRKRG